MEEKGQTIINVHGDYVQEKHVEQEFNVEEGGIAIQNNYYGCAQPEEVESNETPGVNAESKDSDNTIRKYFDINKIKEINTRTEDEIYDNIHNEVKRNKARYVIDILKKYEEYGYLNFGKDSKQDIYDTLKITFGDEIDYGYPAFNAAANEEKFHSK